MATAAVGGRGHRRTQSTAGQWAKQAELANAYSALAAELTTSEIKNLGGYSLGRVIGEGAFGKVRLGVHRLTGTRVAVKQVSKSLPGGQSSDPASPLSLLTRELHHHRRLRHAHLLTLYELLATESSIYLITELCAGGELFDYLVEHGRLSTAEARRLFGQLCLGVAYLHGEGVVHRDLKLENVLLDENVNVKIADLGFARETDKGRWLETRVGTVGYTAPEVLRGGKYLGEEIDIWSLGVILYALVTGSLPFDDDDEDVMRELILRGEYDLPGWLDADVADLIRAILVPDPFQRPSIRTILSHPFFTRPSDPDPAAQLAQQLGAGSSSSPPSIASASGTSGGPLRPVTSRSSSRASFPAASSSLGEVGEVPAAIPEDALPAIGPSASSSSLLPAPVPVPVPASPELGAPVGMSAVKAGKKRALEMDEHSGDDASQPPVPGNPLLFHHGAPMHRTSSAGAVSIRSSHSSHQLPHATPHARTPSRTKRRSIGSIVSERLALLDELEEGGGVDAPFTASPSPYAPAEPRIDFLAILSAPNPPPLSTAAEHALLDALEAVGVDAGQVAHSVKTHACDSCAAVWWMVKRKADEKERIRQEMDELERERSLGAGGGGGLSRTSSLRSLTHYPHAPARRGSMRGRAQTVAEAEESDDDLQQVRAAVSEERRAVLPASPPRPPSSEREPPSRPRTPSPPQRAPRRDNPPQTPSRLAAPLHTPLTPSRAPPPVPSVGAGASPANLDAEARLDYFLSYPPASQSAPLLSYFPAVEPGSPARNRILPRSKSKDHLSALTAQAQAQPPPPLSSAGGTSTPPLLFPPASPSGSPDVDGSKARSRPRAGSVNMLARATSAIGTSLALIKSGHGGSEGSSTPGASASAEEGDALGSSVPVRVGTPARKSSLPSDDPRLLQPAMGSPPRQAHPSLPSPAVSPRPTTVSLPSSPPRPLGSLPSSASAPTPAAAAAPTPSPALSNTSSHDTFATEASSNPTSSARFVQTRTTSMSSLSSVNSGSGAGGAKKSLKGSNLLNTFKHWFADGQRKRKRASMQPRLGGNGYGEPSTAGYGASSLGRSQSLYVGSPLRRPPMGSRRSSNNSLAAAAQQPGTATGTISRRSSVSSAHRAQIDFTPGRPTALGHHRRPSTDSRHSFSVSERGDHSRPSSLRSFSAQPGSARKRLSKAGSSASGASHSTAKEAIYRRPPTTTVVRRRGGSHSRYGGHHRRSASGATSVSYRSSLSDGGDASAVEEDEFEDEPGAPVIVEEDETPQEQDEAEQVAAGEEQQKLAARARAFRTLSGDFTPPLASDATFAPPSKPSSIHSTSSAPQRLSHAPATFMAHKSTHLFGSPSQPHAPSTSSARRIPHPPRQPLRDVFKSPKEDGGEWVDEDDELAGYGGGLGQGAFRNSLNLDAALGSASGGGGGGSGAGLGDSPAAERTWGGAARFEGRYSSLAAGVTGPTGAGGGGRAAPLVRPAALIEEEEEEEE